MTPHTAARTTGGREPAGGALRLTKWFDKAINAPRVIIVGISDNELVLRYLEAGAAGCVRSADDVAELLQAIRLVARQELALPPSLIAIVAERVAELADTCRKLGGQLDRSFNQRSLTRREREILRLMAEGYGNREIAQQLSIELGTTKNHVHNILDKLSVNSRKDAAACWSLAANQL
jgi:DNA-binding NarL/FixJ family response regulator